MKDFAKAAELGSGSLENGTYRCVAIEMSDHVSFSPAEDSDNVCEAAEEYTIDVCHDGATVKLIDGTEFECEENKKEERIALYLSTISTTLPKEPGDENHQEGNPYTPPTEDSTTEGFQLTGALEVDGETNMEFVADFTGRVAEEDRDGEKICGMESPNWGFRKI